MKFVVIALLAAPVTTALADPPPGGSWVILPIGVKISGGPEDGLSVTDFVGSDGKHHLGLRPTPGVASPVPSNLAKLVKGLIGAWQTGHPERYGDYCTEFFHDLFLLPFGPQDGLTPEKPYYLPETSHRGAVVRVDWLRDGRVMYRTFFYFVDGKISSADTTEPKVRPVYQDPPK